MKKVSSENAVRLLLRRSKAEGQEHSLDVQRAGCTAFAVARGLAGHRTVEYVSDGVAGDDIEGLIAYLRRLPQPVTVKNQVGFSSTRR